MTAPLASVADRSSAASYRFTVNGEAVDVTAHGGRRLLDVLRLDLGLTGSKEGCGEGECGACSVLLDGELVDSCLVPVCQVEGREVRTVEGLASRGRLDPLQAAFLEAGGVQCGICTPGMLMAGRAFLDSGVDPTEAAIREAISGNLCRCTGYSRIIAALRLAATSPAADIPVIAPGAAPTLWPGLPLELGDPQAMTPRTLAQAYELLGSGRWRPLAGGTDVLVERAAGLVDTRGYLDLSRLEALRGIRVEGTALALGAATTYAELRRDPLVAEHAPVLAAMAARIGAAQIQHRGTLGGNLGTASPAGDSLPVLLALDAEILAGSSRGERAIPVASFFTAYRRTTLAPDELILGVRVPLDPSRTVVFEKVGLRYAQAISVVVMAIAWRHGEGGPTGPWTDVRVALGSVAPTPIRVPAVETILEGVSPSAGVAAAAAAALAAQVTPIDDVRATAEYRREVAGRALHRIVRDAGGR